MKEERETTGTVQFSAALMAQVRACLPETGFDTLEAFVHYCVEKELKARRAAGEKALAERLRGLGYLE